MGNKLGRRRQVVDDKYTRPQGLYQHRDVDHKKLRKLILDSKLAPCYPGDEDCSVVDLEECPICFLYYPSLNRSRCCMKGICTECFLQMKPPHSARPTQCPFCKTSNYAVEYRGARTKEEKGKEQIEEQRVIEAKIKMQQQERHNEEERLQKKQAVHSLSTIIIPGEVEYQDLSSSSLAVTANKHLLQDGKFLSSQSSFPLPISRQPSNLTQNREDEFDLDLEEIMVMEAIWLSIQDHDNNMNLARTGSRSSVPSSSGDNHASHVNIPTETCSSNGLACAAAAVAESQHMNGDSCNGNGARSGSFSMSPTLNSLQTGGERSERNYSEDNWIHAQPSSGEVASRDDCQWAIDHGSEVAEAGTSYASSDVTFEARMGSPYPDAAIVPSGNFIPETYEEQMMLAMAVSLADARARVNAQGKTWM